MNTDAFRSAHPAIAHPTSICVLAALTVLCLVPRQAVLAQTASPAPPDSVTAKPDSAAKKASKWRFVHRNEFETPFMTLRFGAAVLMEQNWFEQDRASREQVALIKDPPVFEAPETIVPNAMRLHEAAFIENMQASSSREDPPEIETRFKFRDTRFMLSGRIKTKLPILWSAGFMWDAGQRKFLIRQTGFVVPVPGMWGHLWIGRSKEGTSMNRVMVGYDGWTMERFTFSDASIPLLVDGVRWMGYLPNRNLIWNVGVFGDALSKGQTFSYYEHQFASRIAYLGFSEDSTSLLHAGVNFRIGRPTDDTLQLRSKPEATVAPNYVDTGKFHSDLSGAIGVEAYYRPGSWLFGGEYYVQQARSAEAGNPIFHGGDITAIWLVTGETRPYTTVGGYFRSISPKRPLFEGGLGAFEMVLRLSYIDLNSGTLTGGTFWRVTPTVNWYLNRNLRLELGYGYGVLDRFDMKGTTHFFQTRLQSQL
jgi:phosphate-selective porin OprO and OprP